MSQADGVSSPSDWPTVVVVIPVHGDRGGLRSTAEAVAAQDYPGDYRVVVADNGDNEALHASLSALASVDVVVESKPGSYAARNTAVRGSTSDVLAFTDGDCLPRPDWLRAGVTWLRGRDAPAFVGGAIELFPAAAGRPTMAEQWDCLNGLRQDRYVNDFGWAATANMLTTRATYDMVGPFDEGLLSGGDREWGERAVTKGATALYAADAVVDHPARHSMKDLAIKIQRVTQGDVDRRRATGRTAFEEISLWAALRPNTRSIVRDSRGRVVGGVRRRGAYIVAAHVVQYLFVLSRLRASVHSRRVARQPV